MRPAQFSGKHNLRARTRGRYLLNTKYPQLRGKRLCIVGSAAQGNYASDAAIEWALGQPGIDAEALATGGFVKIGAAKVWITYE